MFKTASILSEVTLWPGDDKTPRLTIINEPDFPIDEALKGLGIADSPLRKTFGITDKVAIAARLELTAYLYNNPSVSELLRKINLVKDLPVTEDLFLKTFPQGDRSFFWKQVTWFIEVVEDSENPPLSVLELVKQCKAMLSFEASEKTVVAEISATVERMAYAEAIFRFPLKLEPELIEGKTVFKFVVSPPQKTWLEYVESVLGYRKYGGFVSEESDYAALVAKKLSRFHLGWWYIPIWQSITRETRKRQARRASVIRDFAVSSMVGDVTAALTKKLSAYEPHRDKVDDHYCAYVSLRYDEEGMKVCLMGLKHEVELREPVPVVTEDTNLPVNLADFQGFSRRQRKRIEKNRVRAAKLRRELILGQHAAVLTLSMSKSLPDFANGEEFKIPSPLTDREFKWSSVSGLYNLDRHYEATQRMRKYRKYFFDHLGVLQSVQNINDQIVARAKKFRLPVCVPEMVEGHTIQCEGFVPSQIMLEEGRKRRLVVMRGVPELNGRMIALTGSHGGGKTQILHSLPLMTYCAQSGILSLGESFTFNPKKALGLLFITQRGTGSTIEIILRKLGNIIDGVKKFKPHEVVVVLDEVGTATQERDGTTLGKRILSTLRTEGVSVMFSTQIQDLANWAVTELNAIPVWVNSRHVVKMGVHDGDLDALVNKRRLGRKLEEVSK